MSVADPTAERPIPPVILVGGGLVMAISLALVASARTGLAPRQAAPRATAVASLDFRVAPDGAGGETVVAARGGARVAALSARGDDFLPTLIDKLGQERRLRGAPASPPFRLVRWSDGRVTLDDPATGREIQLQSFGSINQAHAAKLIAQGQIAEGQAAAQAAGGSRP